MGRTTRRAGTFKLPEGVGTASNNLCVAAQKGE